MRLTGIGVAVPSRRVTNDDIVQMVADSRARDAHSGAIERSIRSLLAAAGSEVRYYRAPREHARDLIRSAMNDALVRAGLRAQDIDLLIHCSVGRGFLEPGNAYFCANMLGARCECFDVADACMGWLRAANMAHDGLAAARYRRVMVVNAEFGVQELLAHCCKVESPLELRRTFTAFTLGEVAAAAIFERGDESWSFAYRSRPDLADLCTLPLPGHTDFAVDSQRLAGIMPLRLDAHSAELFSAAEQELTTLIAETIPDLSAPDLYVPHSASITAAIAAAQRADMPLDKLYASVMPRFGNVASASLPLGLFLAAGEGRLPANADVVLCPASAGVCVAVARFRWSSGGERVAG